MNQARHWNDIVVTKVPYDVNGNAIIHLKNWHVSQIRGFSSVKLDICETSIQKRIFYNVYGEFNNI